jgi:hypothetical protein
MLQLYSIADYGISFNKLKLVGNILISSHLLKTYYVEQSHYFLIIRISIKHQDFDKVVERESNIRFISNYCRVEIKPVVAVVQLKMRSLN